MTRRHHIALVIVALVAGGCYDPTFRPNLPCSESGDCPAGQGCQAGLCMANELLPDAPIVLDDGGGPCVGLECFQGGCEAGGTVVTGTVNAPNGTLPLYDVLVYVANGPVPDLPAPASCRRCEDELPANALVSTRTDINGFFFLGDMPATSNVRLVIQTGQWRRQYLIPEVPACTTTALAPEDTRLPRDASEGELPRIALSTGGADALECLLRKVGIADSEFGIEGGAGHVHMFAGPLGTDQFDAAHGSASFPTSVAALWNDQASLDDYDMVVMSCEGGRMIHTTLQHAAVKDYVDTGGRVLADHWHDSWLTTGPAPWPTLVDFEPRADLGVITASVDQSFPRGAAFAQWLVAVMASNIVGSVQIAQAEDTVEGIAAGVRKWIYQDLSANGAPTIQHLSFTTPFGVAPELQCGRFMFTDIHVAAGDSSSTTLQFPSGGCSTPVTSMVAQEKAIIFQLFELGRCVDSSGT